MDDDHEPETLGSQLPSLHLQINRQVGELEIERLSIHSAAYNTAQAQQGIKFLITQYVELLKRKN